MAKIFSTLWTHKKKSFVFAGTIAWGTNYGLEKKKINDIMRGLCVEAKTFGDKPIPVGQQIRKAVVILNYGAHKSKARKLYENYAAPLLNLAGIQTTIYATDDTSKLRDYLDHMETTDAVIFAGGNDTIYECIQSYFKLDKPQLLRTPVGILPLGYSNVVYNALRPEKCEDVLKLAHSALDIVRGTCIPNDVLEIKIADQTERDYALAGIQWGPIKEAENRLPKYWYFGSFAPVFTYSLATLKKYEVAKNEDIVRSVHHLRKALCKAWIVFASIENWIEIPTQAPTTAISAEVNEDCGLIHEETVATQDLHILSQNMLPVHSDQKRLIMTYKRPESASFVAASSKRSRLLNEVDKVSDHAFYGKRVLSEIRIVPTESDLLRYPTIEIDGHNVEMKGPLHAKIHSRKIFLFSPEAA